MGVYKRKDRDDNCWWIQFFDETRTRRRMRIGPDRRVAVEVLKLKQGEVSERRFLSRRQIGREWFDEFVERYLRDVAVTLRSKANVEHSLRLWKQHFGRIRLGEIRTEEIEVFRAKRLRVLRPASCNRLVAHLRAALNVAIQWGLLETNPASRVKALRENNMRLRFLTNEQAAELVRVAAPSIRLFLVLAMNLGARRGEILAMRWCDINWEARTVSLPKTKSGRRREVPINATAERALRKAKRKGAHVITVSLSTLRRNFDKVCEELELEDWRLHDLRHVAASALVQSGVDLAVVREILGHASMATTLRYAHLSPNASVRAVDRIGLGDPEEVREKRARYRTRTRTWPRLVPGSRIA